MFAQRFTVTMCAIAALVGCTESRSYAEHCATPLPHWRTPADGSWHLLPYNRVTIERPRQIRWNDKAIGYREFKNLLTVARSLEPRPALILIFAPDVDCIDVINIRRIVDETYGCSELKLCGEGDGDWDRYGGQASSR